MMLRLSYLLAALTIGFTSPSFAFQSWNGRILDVGADITLTRDEFISVISRYPLIAMGELHYTPDVQEAEARLIMETTAKAGTAGRFALGWEFLNASDQAETDKQYRRFLSGEIDAAKLLTILQKTEAAAAYAPVMEAMKAQGGALYGLNLSRALKSIVVKDGLKGLPSGVVPDGFEMGGAHYLERFKDAMSGHVPAEKLPNYFEAQCLTDDVMAVNILKISSVQTFVIAGNFHTDYFDGTIRRIAKRTTGVAAITVRFVDASDYTEAELLMIKSHERYGDISDFVVFLNEPKAE